MLDRLRQLRGAVPDDDIAGRSEALVVRGNEFGFDEFGLSRTSFRGAARVARWIYRHYFRAQAFGIEHNRQVRRDAAHTGRIDTR